MLGYSGLNIDVLSAIVFVILLSIFIFWKRDRITLQKVLFPLIYVVLFRTKLGLKLMDKLSTKYREYVKFLGYCAIGLGFFGMLYISVMILLMLWLLIFRPEVQEASASLVLPFTNVAGVGFLSFWHWIISIFILAIIHEFAHGVVARAHDVDVKSSGFAVFGILLPAIPAAFVEPDEKVLKKKDDIVQYSVFAAGPMTNITLALIMLILMPYVGFGTIHFGTDLAPFESQITEPVGFSYTLINESYPAALSGMPESGIINGLNGEDVVSYNDFALEMLRSRPGDEVTISVGDTEYNVVTTVNPDDERVAFVGILRDKNERKVKESVKPWFATTFYWFKGLFKWIFLLNFLIGLFNLLPLAIVDGGRMFQVMLGKLIKNQDKAKKIWSFVAILFITILLFSLLTRYLGNPFSLLQ